MKLDVMAFARGRRRASYDAEFFDGVSASSVGSARTIVPLVFDLLGKPRSVVDVGCGAGAWLSVFAEGGVSDILGIDGDYVERDMLLIDAERFRACDLSRPLSIGRRFDLVVCLEVAEHLPDRRAEGLIADLVDLGGAVLFSAAIPYQGGVGHVNEQWPDYWRVRFESHGYVGLDPFRMRLWDDEGIQPWFAQNLVLYVDGATLDEHEQLRAELQRSGGRIPALVHPRTYASKARVATMIMDALPRPLLDSVRRRLRVRP